MRKNFFPIMLLAAALGITSCSDKDIVDVGNVAEESQDYMFVNAAITLPSSAFTRSTTDEGPTDGNDSDQTNSDATPTDSEVGAAYENEVRSMILVIADKNDKYIAHSVVKDLSVKPNGDYEVIGGFKTSDLQKAYEGDNPLISTVSNDVNIYAFCNYTARLLDLFEGKIAGETTDDWINWNGVVEEAPSPAGQTPTISNTIWAQRSFLMTNSKKFTAAFPKTFEEWEPFSDKTHPYDLIKADQAITVERAAARIDFKDGSKNNNTYPVITAVYPDTDNSGEEADEPDAADGGDDDTNTGATQYDEKNFFSVKLSRMALVNMSKNFYYLRRVSDDGLGADENYPTTNSNNWEVGGKETITNTVTIGNDDDAEPKKIFNYVVDTDAAAKQAGTITEANEAQYFNFALFNSDKSYNNSGWYVDDIKDVLEKGRSDNWNDNSYHVWRYVTENTIPAKSITKADEDVTGSDDSPQQTVQSTGIVFKGAITLGEDEDETGRYVTEQVKDALEKSAQGDKAETSTYDFPILYSFNTSLYAGMKELVAAAVEDGKGGPLYNAVEEMLSYWVLGSDNKTYNHVASKDSEGYDEKKALSVERCDIILNERYDEDNFKEVYKEDFDATGKYIYTIDAIQTAADGKTTIDEENFMTEAPKEDSKITVYEATNEGDNDGWGYYCYYFYWNRHNDNGLSGKMGQMEFATVRNNVYKLSVTKINQFGHPRNTKHDPDPVAPNDPDEDPTNYLKVNVEVLPWVVRVNEIEF